MTSSRLFNVQPVLGQYNIALINIANSVSLIRYYSNWKRTLGRSDVVKVVYDILAYS